MLPAVQHQEAPAGCGRTGTTWRPRVGVAHRLAEVRTGLGLVRHRLELGQHGAVLVHAQHDDVAGIGLAP